MPQLLVPSGTLDMAPKIVGMDTNQQNKVPDFDEQIASLDID